MMHHGVKVEFVRPFQQLFHAPSVMACLGEYSLHQLSIQQCHACCLMLLQVHTSMLCQACPFDLSYTLSHSSLDATVPTPSLHHANSIVCRMACSSPMLMQVRYCQNSNQSYPLQRQCCLPDGVDSVRGYNQPFVGLILGVGARPDDTSLFPQMPAILYSLLRLMSRLGMLLLVTHTAISQVHLAVFLRSCFSLMPTVTAPRLPFVILYFASYLFWHVSLCMMCLLGCIPLTM